MLVLCSELWVMVSTEPTNWFYELRNSIRLYIDKLIKIKSLQPKWIRGFHGRASDTISHRNHFIIPFRIDFHRIASIIRHSALWMCLSSTRLHFHFPVLKSESHRTYGTSNEIGASLFAANFIIRIAFRFRYFQFDRVLLINFPQTVSYAWFSLPIPHCFFQRAHVGNVIYRIICYTGTVARSEYQTKRITSNVLSRPSTWAASYRCYL